MIKDENFISIQGWMLKLGIKGNALIAFACIYGFSQDGKSEFRGSAQYIADWCGISRTAAFSVLKSLVDKNLIIKNEIIDNGVKLCNYRHNINGGKETCQDIKKLDRGGQETYTGGSQETCHHTIYSYDKDTIVASHKPKKQKQDKGEYKPYGEYRNVFFYDCEYELLVKKEGKEVIDKAIEIVDLYLYNNPDKHYTDFNRVFNKWALEDARKRLMQQSYSKPLTPKVNIAPPPKITCCGEEYSWDLGFCKVCGKTYNRDGTER